MSSPLQYKDGNCAGCADDSNKRMGHDPAKHMPRTHGAAKQDNSRTKTSDHGKRGVATQMQSGKAHKC